MTKHADILDATVDWLKTKQQSARQRRNKELRPAWWANTAADVGAVGAANAVGLNMFKPLNYEHYTRDASGIRDIVEASGLDLPTFHVPGHVLGGIGGPTAQNYGYSPTSAGYTTTKMDERLYGLPEGIESGRHGFIMKQMGDPEQWHIPALAHEIGHAQEGHTMGVLPKLIQKSRTLGALGVLGSGVESYRALSNNQRPLSERAQMLDRASIMGGIGTAPSLINEFRASRNGLRFLKSLPLENKAGILEEAGRMYPRAFSTYALMAAAPVLAPQIAKLFLPHHVD